ARRGDLSAIRAALVALRADDDASASLFGKLALTYDPDRGLHAGASPPPLALDDAERTGVPIDLADFRGRVLVLHFWATWCQGCREGVAALERAYAEHRDRGLAIVSVSLDEDWATVQQFRASTAPMRWIHARTRGESSAEVEKRFEIVGSTKSVVIGRDGSIASDNLHPGEPEFERLLARLLAAKGPT
ncbi:MAG TPA: TlpA disulfide reductase family protein, partial [Nannocystaceae bacterium]|nr:TlpA disulfide reductase family protein [Nannocystaceae bacterium]